MPRSSSHPEKRSRRWVRARGEWRKTRRLLSDPELKKMADRHGATPPQVALAWLLRQRDLIVIPKTGTPARVRENRTALELRLGEQDLAALDRAFPPPTGPRPLEIL